MSDPTSSVYQPKSPNTVDNRNKRTSGEPGYPIESPDSGVRGGAVDFGSPKADLNMR